MPSAKWGVDVAEPLAREAEAKPDNWWDEVSVPCPLKVCGAHAGEPCNRIRDGQMASGYHPAREKARRKRWSA